MRNGVRGDRTTANRESRIVESDEEAAADDRGYND